MHYPAREETTMTTLFAPIARQVICVQVAETLAAHQYPDEAARIDRAAQIVRQAQVRPLPDRQWAVDSQTQTGFAYTVSPHGCNCLDKAATAGRCKHFWAVLLHKRVQALLDTQRVAQDQKDRAFGLATEVSLPGAREYTCWLLSTEDNFLPRYVPDYRLVLGDRADAVEA